MKNKKGISLIVLVITIIVMIILAAAVVITLSNTEIINRANVAVEKTNQKQIEQLVSLAWSEAFMEGARTQEELQAAVDEVLIENKINTSDYNIEVTTSGVYVEAKGGSNVTNGTNEYGFYYDEAYRIQINDQKSADYVAHEDGSAEIYLVDYDEDLQETVHYLMAYYPAGYATYSKNEITMLGDTLKVSDAGNKVSMGGEDVATRVGQEMHGIYRGYTYSATVEGEGTYKFTLDANNEMKVYKNETLSGTYIVASLANDNLLTIEGQEIAHVITADGTKVLIDDIIFTIEGTPKGELTPAVPFAGAVITPVEGSSVEAIKAGNPKTGDTIAYNGYTYKCNQVNFAGQWTSPDELVGDSWWGVEVTDKTRTSYLPIEATFATKDVTALWFTYNGCDNLTSAPILPPNVETLSCTFLNCEKLDLSVDYHIPESVTYMFGTFSGCKSLTNAPKIPENVYYMEDTFYNCASLQTAPVIPSKVTNMVKTFQGCTSLTGTVTVNATNIEYHNDCFLLTTLPIELTGECPASLLTSLAATSESGNVTVKQTNN